MDIEATSPLTAAGVVYAVAVGRDTGVFDTWAECNMATNRFSGCCYKKFAARDRHLAEDFVRIAAARSMRGLAPIPEVEAVLVRGDERPDGRADKVDRALPDPAPPTVADPPEPLAFLVIRGRIPGPYRTAHEAKQQTNDFNGGMVQIYDSYELASQAWETVVEITRRLPNADDIIADGVAELRARGVNVQTAVPSASRSSQASAPSAGF